MIESPYLWVSFIALVYIYSSQLLKSRLKHRYNQPVYSTFFGLIVSIIYFIFTNTTFTFDQ